MTIRTHYDNLHIHSDASEADIRQAYRRLSKKYHPDLNPNEDAHRIMQLINQAYDVLSNPEKRAQHDRWIAEQQALLNAQKIMQKVPHIKIVPQSYPQASPVEKNNNQLILIIMSSILLMLLLLGVYVFWVYQNKKLPESNISTQNAQAILRSQPINQASNIANSPIDNTSYIRPFAAPNGNPWPNESAYITGYPLIYGRGKHQLYIDNALNSSDVYAQLWQEGINEPLRHFFIPERSYLILTQLDAGNYTIRYQQLDAGEELLSEYVRIDAQNQNNTLYLKRGQSPQH